MEYVEMGLTFAFIILFSMLLWIIIGVKGSWILKLILISTSLSFAVLTGSSLENFYGWPTIQQVPDECRIYWALAREPDDAAGFPGELFIWAESNPQNPWANSDSGFTFKNNRMSGVRAYKLPYSVDMHEKIVMITEKIMAGQVVVGSINSEDIPEEFMINGDRGDSNLNSDDINFYALPPVGSIKKQHGN